MANDAASSVQSEHSSSMLDFLKGTLKEVPRPCLLMGIGQLLLLPLCCIYSSSRHHDMAAAAFLWRWC